MKTVLKVLAFAAIAGCSAFAVSSAKFQSLPTYATPGVSPLTLALGDFNHDGSLDVAAVAIAGNGVGTGVYIFLNNGDGTFRSAVLYPAGGQPEAVVVADFNGDGKLDLAIANGTPIDPSRRRNAPATCQ